MRSILLFLFLCSNIVASGQNKEYNFDFEEITNDRALPESWLKWDSKTYKITVDSLTKYHGKYSASIFNSPFGEKGSFGSLAFPLPAMSGSVITLEGFIKTSNVKDGFAGLLIKQDAKDGRVLAFEDMSNENVQGSNDWKKYKLNMPLSGETETIFIGAILTGTGHAWFDSFKVFIDGKDIQLEFVNQQKAKADADREFDDGSRIKIERLSNIQHKSLFQLAKVWGYLKYYHPVIGDGELNWDYELFRVISRVLKCSTNIEADKELARWIESITTEQALLPGYELALTNLALSLDLEWITVMQDEKLRQQLEAIKNARRKVNQYYVSLTPGVGNPVFNNEKSYSSTYYPDTGFRLLSLFRYWNMIEYFFPYKKLIDVNWDSVLYRAIPKMIECKNELDYRLSILELIGKVSDSHAQLRSSSPALESFYGKRIVPVEIEFVQNKAVVRRFYNEDFASKTKLRIGDVLTKVNNVEVKEIINKRIKYFPGSNHKGQLVNFSKYLLRTNDTILQIQYSRKFFRKKLNVETIPYATTVKKENLKAWKKLDGNIGYIYPGSLKISDVDEMMQQLKNTNGLIIDFRCYPAENILYHLGRYLMPAPIEFAKFSIPSTVWPGYFYFTKPVKVGEENQEYYKGKVVIIVNETTLSSAEFHAMALRKAPRALVIGSNTAGADGNVSRIYLPGDVLTTISGIGVFYPDGEETQRIGITPDIKVDRTVKGIRRNVDEFLEAAIESINK